MNIDLSKGIYYESIKPEITRPLHAYCALRLGQARGCAHALSMVTQRPHASVRDSPEQIPAQSMVELGERLVRPPWSTHGVIAHTPINMPSIS